MTRKDRLKLEAKVEQRVHAQASAKRRASIAKLRTSLATGRAQLANINQNIALREQQIATFIDLRAQTESLMRQIEFQLSILESAHCAEVA